jgi:uncharacterized protein YeaO (DUF488 family)
MGAQRHVGLRRTRGCLVPIRQRDQAVEIPLQTGSGVSSRNSPRDADMQSDLPGTRTVCDIVVRRLNDPPPDPDGSYRILVDRVWPRGLSRAAGRPDEWCRDIAPSAELHRWYGHDPARFPAFRIRYLTELDDPAHAVPLAYLCTFAGARLTLLTAATDLDISPARTLAERLSWA